LIWNIFILIDASLKNTTFTNENSLIDIDFTNTDLFGSYIDITALNSTTITVNTRFPDGSFQNINSKELVNDGGAEQQVIIRFSSTRSTFFRLYFSAIHPKILIGGQKMDFHHWKQLIDQRIHA
jgi:hypothetical protein